MVGPPFKEDAIRPQSILVSQKDKQIVDERIDWGPGRRMKKKITHVCQEEPYERKRNWWHQVLEWADMEVPSESFHRCSFGGFGNRFFSSDMVSGSDFLFLLRARVKFLAAREIRLGISFPSHICQVINFLSDGGSGRWWKERQVLLIKHPPLLSYRKWLTGGCLEVPEYSLWLRIYPVKISSLSLG